MELRTHRMRRVFVVMLVAATPSAAIAWSGCSSSTSDNNGGTGRVNVDPGGTFGADIGVTVLGRGRVTSNVPGLECPRSCYAGLAFADRNQDGAAGGVALKAVATPGARFTGWKFETVSLGARGRGPELCNPVKRDSVSPPLVDLGAAEITLPYGEASGTLPAGQEAVCAGYATVPVAYRVTATFVDDIVDAGFDGDGDAGGGEIFLESPVPNAVGHAIGIAGGRLYWLYDVGGVSSIATASTSVGSVAQTVSGTSGFYTAFEIGTHVVWENSGTIGVIQGGSTIATTFSSGGNNCVAMESEFANVFCRTAGPNGNLISWSTAGTAMTTLHSGLPTGAEFTVDSSGFSLVDATNGAGATTIKNIPRTGTPDAGVPTFSDAVTGLTNPTLLESNSSRLFWIAEDLSGTAQSASRFGGSAFSSTPPTNGLRALSTDPSSSSSFFVAISPSAAPGGASIVKLSAFSTTAVMVRQNLTGVGGVTADSSYVYWTQNDGRVYRAARTGF
jgi:hypothetical protein